jgi:hypothetical protein
MIAPGASGHAVPALARELASLLSALLQHDVEIVERLNDAQRRLAKANERPWFGPAPDACGDEGIAPELWSAAPSARPPPPRSERRLRGRVSAVGRSSHAAVAAG